MECAVWLMMEYEAQKNSLNPMGLALLLDLRSDWNIERAKSVMLSDSEDEGAENESI